MPRTPLSAPYTSSTHSWLSASATMPATLALMTEVGPPDWPTKTLPTSSAMGDVNKGLHGQRRSKKAHHPTGRQTKKPPTIPHSPRFSRFRRVWGADGLVSEQPAGPVVGGALELPGERPHLGDEGVHLAGRRADEARAFAEE